MIMMVAMVVLILKTKTSRFLPATCNLGSRTIHTCNQFGLHFISRGAVTELTLASVSKSVNFTVLQSKTTVAFTLLINGWSHLDEPVKSNLCQHSRMQLSTAYEGDT